jgi:benzoate membrane transport protein
MTLRANLRDLPRSLVPSAWVGALAATVISFSAPVVIVQQASDAAGIGVAGFGSWIAAAAIGAGVASIVLSLAYRLPIMCAWSTPGAALLVTSIGHYPYRAVIGAYVAAALVTLVVGVTGVFRRLMALVPEPVVMGVLAGVLFRFGVGVVTAVPEAPEIVLPMVAAYLLLSRLGRRAPAIGAIAVGIVIAAVLGRIDPAPLHAGISEPVFTRPEFALDAIVGIGLPLFVLTMAAQNATGFGVLRASGYADPPIDGVIATTGVASLLAAPFGANLINLSVLTASYVTLPPAHPDPRRRYAAAVAVGGVFILVGLAATAIATLFAGLPAALVAAMGGIGMLGILVSATAGAVGSERYREAGVVALLVTASGTTIAGIGAPFWGLVAGAVIAGIARDRTPPRAPETPAHAAAGLEAARGDPGAPQTGRSPS